MPSGKLSYVGIAGAVAGIVGLFGIYANWFTVSGPGGTVSMDGTADPSGALALAMSIAMFAFGAAYVLIPDLQVRRAVGALMAVCAVVLTLACVWALRRFDGAAALGLWVSGLGGVLGVGGGVLALRDISEEADAARPADDEAQRRADVPATSSTP
jgi:hypothetical protein